jgi:2-succinyl-5-enolpyruvyl-6-hydroxy-3-cyclohexene-1-carboxylate synthase
MAGVNPSTALARVLVDELARSGVTEVVLAPGSRNAPLSLALHAADAAGRLRLHVRIDERTAGFLALGLARGSGRAAAVVTTSGTAVANLHPAVLEAHHDAVPLLVLSADRPPWLRDVGANQVIDRPGRSSSTFRSPTRCCPTTPTAGYHMWTRQAGPGRGPGAGRRTSQACRRCRRPNRGMHLLDHPGFLARGRPDRVVVLGRPTLFRQVQALLSDPHVVVDVVAHPAGYADPAGRARMVAPGRPDVRHLPDAGWAARWRDAAAAAGKAVADLVDRLDLDSSPRLARELIEVLPARATVVLGSSQPPRDLALSTRPRDGIRLIANRGVAGIDGTISTAVGVALTAGAREGPTVALLGDLTFLHDLTGLVIGPAEPRPDLTIVVSNNDGGAIFATLESGEPRHAHAFERVFGTPHGVDLAGLVRSCGLEHVTATTGGELRDALAHPGGLRVVEVRTSRTELVPTMSRITEAVRGAV